MLERKPLWGRYTSVSFRPSRTMSGFIRLPRVRTGTLFLVIGAAHFASRRFGEAVPKLLLAIQDDPGFPLAYRCLAACYAHMGRLDDAREIVARLRAMTSVVMPDARQLRNAEHRELLLSGLRLAAGEAG